MQVHDFKSAHLSFIYSHRQSLYGWNLVFRLFLCEREEEMAGSGISASVSRLTFRLGFAFDARCSVAGAHQHAAAVGFLPLLVWSVSAPVFLTAG